MTILERAIAPTPKFFRILRTIGMALTAIAATIIGAKTSPQEIVDIATHVATAGAVLTAVSQVTVDEQAHAEEQELRGNGS